LTALFRRYLPTYRGAISLVMLLLLVQAIANLYLPELNAEIINNGVVTGDTDYIVQTGAFMLLVTAVLAVVAVVGVFFGARTAMAFGRDVRSAIFRRVQTFGQVEMNLFGAPSLITRNTNDVQQVQMLVLLGLNVMITAPIMVVGGVIMALRQDVEMSGLLVVVMPLIVLIVGLIMRRAIPLFQDMQRKLDRINLVMREKLSGIRVIRAFVRTRHEEVRFDEANVDLMDTSMRVQRLFALALPLLMGVMNLTSVAVLWVGAFRVDSGEMPIGNLVAFLQYIMIVLFSVMMAVFMFVQVPRAAVSGDRIREVLDTEPSIFDPATASAPARRGEVEFRSVQFRYPGAEQPVLSDISFTAEAGHTTAVVGSTGSGKTTLIDLIPRLYDVTDGSVLIDGVDVRELDRADLWRRVALTPQRAFLFSGTVASNLRYGDEDATDDELWHALGIAQARDFVAAMSDGLESEISQGGTNVSGGQRQRLSIARAIVHKPDVFIFDDSFSALDFRTDARLRAALDRELAEATLIIVAQRVGTILHADRIVVLEEGRVVGIGPHQELMESCQTYREIVLSQATEEELS
jgi:ATP-binding cassette subfamily B multidrug efflux pump